MICPPPPFNISACLTLAPRQKCTQVLHTLCIFAPFLPQTHPRNRNRLKSIYCVSRKIIVLVRPTPDRRVRVTVSISLMISGIGQGSQANQGFFCFFIYTIFLLLLFFPYILISKYDLPDCPDLPLKLLKI